MFDVLLATHTSTMITVFVLSLCIGSFLNVVVYRLPIMMRRQLEVDCLSLNAEDDEQEFDPNDQEVFNLSKPASACPKCNSPIRAWQNIPVISFLWLKGKCANCKTSINPRYPSVELITGLLGLLVAYLYGATWECAALLVFTYFLVALTLIDFDEYLLPDSLTLPLIWIGLIANSFSLFTTLESAVFGAVAGYLSLWSIYWLFKIVTGKEGMGYGDFKLLAAIGAFLGWQILPVVILLSSLVGAIVGITMILMLGRDKNIPIPFGPYLAAAGFIAALYGEQIMMHYMKFIGL